MAFETLDPEHQSAADTKEYFQLGEDVAPDHPDAALPLHGPNVWPAEVRPVDMSHALSMVSWPVVRSLSVSATETAWLRNCRCTAPTSGPRRQKRNSLLGRHMPGHMPER